MTEVLHARSGVVLEHRDDDYRLTSLRLENPRDFDDLAEPQDVFMGQLVHTLFGHAVDASQVAAVCYGKSQIIDGSVVVVQ